MTPINSVTELIGKTPLLYLQKMSSGSSKIFAKAEFLNPGGSIKDRPAKYVIEKAIEEGYLKPGQTVVEMTSGNMGAGLALVCAALNHPFVAVMSQGNSQARVRMLEALGAEVVLVEQVDGIAGKVTGADVRKADSVAREIAKKRKAYFVNQFHNPHCIDAHFKTTGPEIWSALGSQLTHFVSCVGSSGTFTGVAKYLKQCNPAIACIAVEPTHCEVLAGGMNTKPQHLIQGTSYGIVPPHWQKQFCDDFIAVNDDEVTVMKQRLGVKEGLCVGFSAAANIVAASRVAFENPNACIVTLLCDTGLKY